jgi:hypothetical protein
MPVAIVAGVPPDIDRRIQAALRSEASFGGWQILWLRSNGRTPGLAPGQIEIAANLAAEHNGANLLVFRGRSADDENALLARLVPNFRVRWIEATLLKLIPHDMPKFFGRISECLSEEAVWIDEVKPKDESCCLLLPSCAFSAKSEVRHLWTAASEAGIERIRLAVRAKERFSATHWLPQKNGARAWTDMDGRVFDHRGARHGIAPFPRMWKFAYQTTPGFHFDVTSRLSRNFHIQAFDGWRYNVPGSNHVNIDSHGYIRI